MEEYREAAAGPNGRHRAAPSPWCHPSQPSHTWQVSSVRNRWQRIEKGRKLREQGQELKNRCHACGQPKRGHVCYAKMRGGPQVDVQPMGGAPPELALPTPSGGGVPDLRRMRSGSKLVPYETGAWAPGASSSLFGVTAPPAVGSSSSQGTSSSAQGGMPSSAAFTVDVGAVVGSSSSRRGGPGHCIGRSNTSFFQDLSSSELFSPSSREMFQAWVDSPRDAQAGLVQGIASDVAAPPSLRRCASGEVGSDGQVPQPPKLTRAVSSYIRILEDEANAQAGGTPRSDAGASEGQMPPARLPSQLGPSRESSQPAEPNLGRSITSFVRDFTDVSALLEPPPADAAPPPLLRGSNSLSFGELLANPADTDVSEVMPSRRQSLRNA